MNTHPTTRSAKILIVDDHPMVREGLVARLANEKDLEICGEAASVNEALVLVKQTMPDLVLVDITLKDGHGIDLIKQIKESHADIRMLVFSGFQESLYAERALRAGAQGYVNKQESNVQLIEAIRTVLRGERYVSPDLMQKLVTQALGGREETRDPVNHLSDRELEIFRLLGSGLTSRAIASKLFLSPHTINAHRENIKRKLGANNGTELNRLAVQWVLENG